MAKKWSEQEKDIVRDIWASPMHVKLQTHRLPGRNLHSIQAMAIKLKLGAKSRGFSPKLVEIKALMRDGEPRTSKEIAARVGMSMCQVRGLLAVEIEEKRFHVASWRQQGRNGQWLRLYRSGKGRSAAQPAPMTVNERAAKFLSNVDPDEFEFKRKRYYLRRLIKTGRAIRRDALTEALFGRAA